MSTNTVELTTMQMQAAYNRFENIAGAGNGRLFWPFITSGGKFPYWHTGHAWKIPIEAHAKIQVLSSAYATAIVKAYKIKTPELAWVTADGY